MLHLTMGDCRHLPPEQRITVSPHVLRHTLLRKLAEGKGVRYAQEQSGHRSDRYIWRYVRPSAQGPADALDELAEPLIRAPARP
jgi:integrase/recombinase XerD